MRSPCPADPRDRGHEQERHGRRSPRRAPGTRAGSRGKTNAPRPHQHQQDQPRPGRAAGNAAPSAPTRSNRPTDSGDTELDTAASRRRPSRCRRRCASGSTVSMQPVMTAGNRSRPRVFVDKPFAIAERSAAWTPAASAAARAVPARVDARGGRGARRHHVDRVAAARRARPGRPAPRCIEPDGPAGPADAGRAAAGRPRGDDPRRGRGGARSTWIRTPSPRGHGARGRRSPPPSGGRWCRWSPRLADAPRGVRLLIHEHEPAEALALLAADDVDLALDLRLQPRSAPFDRALESRAAVDGPRGASASRPATRRPRGQRAATVFARYRDHDWIVNSRNTADERGGPPIARWPGFTRDHASRRQPRTGAGPGRRGPRGRAAAAGDADPAGRRDRHADRSTGGTALVRADPGRTRAMAADGRRPAPAGGGHRPTTACSGRLA